MKMRTILYTVCTFVFASITPAGAELVITIKPSPVQKLFPRGELFFSCTSTGALFGFLEAGADVDQSLRVGDNSCGAVAMTKVTRRADYVTNDGRRYQIFRFLVKGWDFYTYNQSNRRWRRH